MARSRVDGRIGERVLSPEVELEDGLDRVVETWRNR